MPMTSDLVSSTILARSREPEGLRSMMIASSAAHVVGLVALVVVPWILGPRTNQPETVMEVSLAGAPGVQSGGMTALADRPVQQVTPKAELPKPQPPRPPAPKPPDMVEQVAKPAPPKPAVQKAAPTTRPAPPTTGAEVRPGQARVETGTQSNEGGLSTGGGGTGGQAMNVNFCDPAYLGQMVSIIYRNWNRQQAVTGRPIVRFVIQRDGTLTEVTLRQPSGYFALDLAATRAVELTHAIPPLPACYQYETYAMNLTFEYIR
jgi:TonB family protein